VAPAWGPLRPAPAAPLRAAPDDTSPEQHPAAATPTLGSRTADQQLRAAILAHQPQLESCVSRQLKLLPDLRAEGTLVIDVDRSGRVTGAALRGPALQGTTLEGCLRSVAVRWRFPRTGRAYAVEAPLEVSGASGRTAP
jgi:hypothetical protein